MFVKLLVRQPLRQPDLFTRPCFLVLRGAGEQRRLLTLVTASGRPSPPASRKPYGPAPGMTMSIRPMVMTAARCVTTALDHRVCVCVSGQSAWSYSTCRVIGLGPAAAAAHPDSAVYIHCSSSSQPGALGFSGCVDAAPGRCCVPITGNFVIARPREPCSSSYRSDLRMKRIYEVGSAAERRRRRIPAAKKLHETIIYRVDKIRGRAGPGRRELSAVHRRVDIYRTTKTEAAAAARKRVAAGAARHGTEERRIIGRSREPAAAANRCQ